MSEGRNLTPVWESSTRELVEEIQKRCTATLIVLEEPDKLKSADASEFRCCWSGGFNAAIGLSVRAREHILSQLVPGWTTVVRFKADNGEE